MDNEEEEASEIDLGLHASKMKFNFFP